MKRLHVHVAVTELAESVRHYSALFAAEPTVLKDDYAKWSLEDPRVNFAISTRGKKSGLDHLGIQVENAAELDEMNQRLNEAATPVREQSGTTCCYARSNKYWSVDPAGIPWETFHTLESAPVYGESVEEAAKETASACCVPDAAEAPVASSGGCGSQASSCC